MNEEQLKQMESEMLKQMKEEEAVEELIEHASEEIARQLMKNMVHSANLNGTSYFFEYITYNQNGKHTLCVKVSTIAARTIDMTKAPRTKLEVEYDDNHTELENVQAIIEAFIRHKTGHIKVEETE